MKHEGMNIRRIIRANRLLSEQGHNGDSIGALNELTELRKSTDRIEHLERVLAQARAALEWCVEQGGGPVCEHEAGGAVCFCIENNAIAAIDEALKS